MKNNADALIFHTTICVEAPQIVLMHRAKTATLLFARASSAALRKGKASDNRKWSDVVKKEELQAAETTEVPK